MSRTFVDPVKGTRVTEIGSQALNFRDARGAWQPIDNKLTPVAGGGWKNGANAYAVTLPDSLLKPVTVSDSANPGAWVSMQLAPAKTPVAALKAVPGLTAAVPVPDVAATSGKAAASAVKYAGALPGVDMGYAALGDAVKETASLASLDVLDALPGASITYTIRTGNGLMLAENKTGGIDVVDAKGDNAFVIPASVMDDANGESSTAITTTLAVDKSGPANTWTLTLTPDRDVAERAGAGVAGGGGPDDRLSVGDGWVHDQVRHAHGDLVRQLRGPHLVGQYGGGAAGAVPVRHLAGCDPGRRSDRDRAAEPVRGERFGEPVLARDGAGVDEPVHDRRDVEHPQRLHRVDDSGWGPLVHDLRAGDVGAERVVPVVGGLAPGPGVGRRRDRAQRVHHSEAVRFGRAGAFEPAAVRFAVFG